MSSQRKFFVIKMFEGSALIIIHSASIIDNMIMVILDLPNDKQ